MSDIAVPDRLKAEIPPTGIVEVAWQMIRESRQTADTQARLNRELAVRVDDLARQVERLRIQIGQMERVQMAGAEQLRRETGITAADMDAVR